MRKILSCLLAVAAGLVAAAPLSAATIAHFDVSGSTPSGAFNFDVPLSPTPASFTATSFTLDDVLSHGFSTVSGPYDFTSDYTFYLAGSTFAAGGVDTARGRYYGGQLFTGSTADPIFVPGIYDVYRPFGQGGADPATIVITTRTVAGAVPEPAAWVMLLVGTGAIGATLRRRAPVRIARIA